MQINAFLLSLIVIFVTAKLFGELAERIGQPAVLGELLGGVIVGVSGLHLVDPHDPTLHLLAELGVLLLLFLIGLETDLAKLIRVGAPSLAVAVCGVALPLAAGIGVGRLLGHPLQTSLFLGAALTATSVGITARVLSDLGHMQSDEAQVILGAAVADDLLGLSLLAVVSGLAEGAHLSTLAIGRIVGASFGFVLLAIVIGRILAPYLIAAISRLRVSRALFFASLVYALALAWTADAVGSGMIIGAFAAGVVLSTTNRGPEIEHQVHDIAQFFVPIFFVLVGAAVDVRSVNPFVAASRPLFITGVVLTLVGIAGKVVAGYAAFGKPLRKIVIGVGMVPRGEVGLIFAQVGLAAGVLTQGLYSSVALMVMATTFFAPPMLRALLARGAKEEASIVCDVVTETMSDGEERRQRDRRSPVVVP